jgi:UDP-glucose 4-epimerase
MAMKILVTGSAGHLGEALVRTLRHEGHTVVGLDVLASNETDVVGSITEPAIVRHCMQGVNVVMHAATLHKPHVATHSHQAFIDTNVTGTLNLLEAAVDAKVEAYIFTSTTSTFGDALSPPKSSPAAWITEDVPAVPKNIYGVTKVAAEDLCQLFHRNHGMPCIVLRTSRFFPEADDNETQREAYSDRNLKVIELLHRRVDIHDVVTAHQAALANAQRIGFGKFIISATTPFTRADLAPLRGLAAEVLQQTFPHADAIFSAQGWVMPDDIDRVYVNARARDMLGWRPEYDFARALEDVARGEDPRSPLARSIFAKGYHQGEHADGRYPVDAS